MGLLSRWGWHQSVLLLLLCLSAVVTTTHADVDESVQGPIVKQYQAGQVCMCLFGVSVQSEPSHSLCCKQRLTHYITTHTSGEAAAWAAGQQ